MSRGDKSAYTDKQKRQAEHIEESEKKEGRSKEDAERIAWATVNKQDGGGKKSGSAASTRRSRPAVLGCGYARASTIAREAPCPPRPHPSAS